MIQFEHAKVYNWLDALRGMRNSWESWDKMDSHEGEEFVFGPNDYQLASTLTKAGPGHDKYLRQVFVSVDIIAPEYWWKETDTYHFFETNSCSMMHRLGKDPMTVDAFSFDEPNHPLVVEYMKLLNQARNEWVDSGKKKPSPEWRLMNQLTAISFLYRRTFTTNYSQLKSMYHQRKNHRLQEWLDFREWVETLPYSELITLKNHKKPPYADLDDE